MKDKKNPKAADAVFTRNGEVWKCWKEAFNRAVERAQIKDFRFHDLRHCYGSWLAMNNIAFKAQVELMRHKDPKMTLRYSHLSVDYKRDAVNKLPRFNISGKKSPQISPQEQMAKVVGFRK